MLVARDFQRRLDSDLAARGILGIRHRYNDVFFVSRSQRPQSRGGSRLSGGYTTSVDDENHSGVGAAGTGRAQA